MIRFLAHTFRGLIVFCSVASFIISAVLGYLAGTTYFPTWCGIYSVTAGILGMAIALFLCFIVNGLVFGFAATLIEIHDDLEELKNR